MRRIAVGLFLVALIALAGFPWAGAEDAVVRPDIVLDDFERET
ncbi:MAG TPA: hypothetical protein PKI05_16625 [Thermogutta sp.]|nr:hypothetical protein [Thermogutta sp.]